jgi:hypothetical protein
VDASPVNVTTSVVNATCAGSTDGSITARGTGDTNNNYTYTLAGPGTNTTQTGGTSSVTFSNLPAGTYTLTTSGTAGCASVTTVTVGAVQGGTGGTADILFNLEAQNPVGNAFPAVGSTKSITYSVVTNSAGVQGIVVQITRPFSTFTIELTPESRPQWEDYTDQGGVKEFRLRPGVQIVCGQKILISVNITRGPSPSGTRSPITANARYERGNPDPNELNNTRAAQYDLQ